MCGREVKLSTWPLNSEAFLDVKLHSSYLLLQTLRAAPNLLSGAALTHPLPRSSKREKILSEPGNTLTAPTSPQIPPEPSSLLPRLIQESALINSWIYTLILQDLIYMFSKQPLEAALPHEAPDTFRDLIFMYRWGRCLWQSLPLAVTAISTWLTWLTSTWHGHAIWESVALPSTSRISIHGCLCLVLDWIATHLHYCFSKIHPPKSPKANGHIMFFFFFFVCINFTFASGVSSWLQIMSSNMNTLSYIEYRMFFNS